MLKNEVDYVQSLRDGRKVFYGGERVDDITEHRILRVAIDHAASLYKIQREERFKDLVVAADVRFGEMSAFYSIPKTSGDLRKRFDLIYKTTELGRGMFNIIKAIGSDAIFALMIVTRYIDAEYKTNYHERVMRFYEEVVNEDLALSVAQTDVKGHRMKRPSQQVDRDLYVRIVERREDGIIVNGAKAHTTQSIASNEIIVLPTRYMTEEDKDYAVAFSIPPNTKGVTMISRPMKATELASQDPNFQMGQKNAEIETLTIFDNVFVPNERIFLAGEWKFAGILAGMFPTFHRFTAISYRAATANLILGLGKLIAEHNGVEGASHIRKDIVNLMIYKENLLLAGLGASEQGEEEKGSGILVPNRVYTNIGKLFANENYLGAVKSLVDITGGLAATLPHSKDFNNPEERELLLKYLAGAIPDGTEERVRLIGLVREMISSYGSLFTTAMLHAEGSIEASVIELYRSYDYEKSKKLALYASGLTNDI